MRYTELNPNVRTLNANELWIGVMDAPEPYIALASRLDDDDPVIVCRFSSGTAKAMAMALVEYAASLEAPDN